MQAAQRSSWNASLEQALSRANELSLPLITLFCVDESVPEANLRHYRFMLEGLWDTGESLKQRGIPLLIALGGAPEIIPRLLADSAEVFMDQGYLRWQREERTSVQRQLKTAGIPWRELSTESIVPVEIASPKEEYSAATLRAKLLKLLAQYVTLDLPSGQLSHPASTSAPHVFKKDLNAHYFSDLSSLEQLLEWTTAAMEIDANLAPAPSFRGGASQAQNRLQTFIDQRLPHYATQRSDPGQNLQSELSPWLHFGQISPLEIVHRVLSANNLDPWEVPHLIRHKAEFTGIKAALASFLEELIVRRELSMNFCWYNPDYDNYAAIPVWARESLEKHAADKRPYLYSLDALEHAETHDPYWNAAQREMTATGKMHNYMRMYWGKKLIEWTPDPETAFHWALYLNNRYELDGRDASSFAGVAWCFGKHDRPWQTRPVFGSVRYMNAAGLERKFDMKAYLERVRSII